MKQNGKKSSYAENEKRGPWGEKGRLAGASHFCQQSVFSVLRLGPYVMKNIRAERENE